MQKHVETDQNTTGMSYSELLNFNTGEHLRDEKGGQQWIVIHRQKTKTLSLIPVIEQAKELLKRYEELQTHMARRTVRTFFLNHGLSIETMSKVLGYKSIKIPQMYYAELLTDTIKQNFKKSGLL